MLFTGDTLSWLHVDDVLEVELHRAPLNEIGTTTLAELEVLARYLQDGANGARALIFHSSRPGFCAGADLRELHRNLLTRQRRLFPELRIRRRVRQFLRRIHAVFDLLDQSPLVTIAAVHGPVFGGGFELALTADQIVADRSARFCFPELRLGLVPGFGGVPRLSRDVGNAVVRDLLLSGRSLGAARAHELGLVSQLVPKGEALAAARRAAAQAVRFGPHVTRAAKRLAKPIPRELLEREIATFCALVTHPDVRAALDRFVNDEGVRPYLPQAATP